MSIFKNLSKVLLAALAVIAVEGSASANQESWYWGFDLGWAKPMYNSQFESNLDSINSYSGASRISLGGSLFFYWPVGTGETVLGVANTAVVDSTSYKNASLAITQSLMAFSAMHTFGSEPGVGPFLRGDAGLAVGSQKITSGKYSLNSTSDLGFGFLAGAGYGIALSDSTRLLFQAKYSWIRVSDDSLSSIQICAGPMF